MKTVFYVWLLFLSNLVTGQTLPSLKIVQLKGDFYIYQTYKEYKGNRISANGMYVVTEKGVVLFDSPWDTSQALPLLDSISKKHRKEVVLAIATHSHDDRTGSFDLLNKKGVKTFASEKTDSICKIKAENRPSDTFRKDTVFTVGQYAFKTYYPGKGHTPDNIVVWFENEKILYGGCFVKSTEATDLGNLSDANVPEWKISLEKTIARFPKPKYVIPGHQSWKNKKSLRHTLQLVRQYLNQ